MTALKVCSKCGWHDVYSHHVDCDADAGAAADHLTSLACDIPSTKLGYGSRRVTFKFDDKRSLTLSVCKDGTFRVEKLFWLSDLTEAGALRLINALKSAISGVGVQDEVSSD